jgi:hyperosmotically inducible periplasmic protein
MILKKFKVIVLAGFLFTSGFVACKGKPSDAEIQTEVGKKLADEAGSGLTASVNKGVVTLTGTCKDEACRSSCAAEAKSVAGVTDVVNNITVPVATAPVEITPDAPLQEAVNNVVKAYADVKAEVKDGVVVLRGQIERPKLQELMMALSALKPKSIDNQLVIK